MIYTNYDGQESPLLHTKFVEIDQAVLEEKIFKVFYHIEALQPSWLCDLDHLYKL